MEILGARIRAARIKQRYDVKAAASAAGIARDTWKRIEAGASVHDTKRQAALDLLGLDDDGHPTVGGRTQDDVRVEDDFVSASGDTVEARITNEDLLREILRSRAASDQIRAEQREQRQLVESLSDRVARLEQPGT